MPNASELMEQLGKVMETKGDDMATKFKGVVVFCIDGQDYTIDLRVERDDDKGTPRMIKGVPHDGLEADLRVSTTDAHFTALVSGKLDPQTAFMMGKIKIKGSMGLAMKLGPLLAAAGKTHSKL